MNLYEKYPELSLLIEKSSRLRRKTENYKKVNDKIDKLYMIKNNFDLNRDIDFCDIRIGITGETCVNFDFSKTLSEKVYDDFIQAAKEKAKKLEYEISDTISEVKEEINKLEE